MNPSRRCGLLLLVALSLAACGGSTPAPAKPANAGPSLEAERARARAVIERACGCDTSACVEGAVAELDPVVMTFAEAKAAVLEIRGCHESVDHKLAAVALDELEVLKRDACACIDPACTEGIKARFSEFMERHKSSKGSEEQAERAGVVAGQMMECLVKAEGDPLGSSGD